MYCSHIDMSRFKMIGVTASLLPHVVHDLK